MSRMSHVTESLFKELFNVLDTVNNLLIVGASSEEPSEEFWVKSTEKLVKQMRSFDSKCDELQGAVLGHQQILVGQIRSRELLGSGTSVGSGGSLEERLAELEMLKKALTEFSAKLKSNEI